MENRVFGANLSRRTTHSKKKELYRTFKKGSVDDKKLANVFKVSKNE